MTQGCAVELIVNGDACRLEVDPLASLADVLRDGLGLTGTKMSCNAGDCGACTVLVDGQPVMACQSLAVTVTGAVTSIEGLRGPAAEALRQAFIQEGGFQCGYCTSGQILAAIGLVERSGSMSDEELARALGGNICRCTGYVGIIRAVRAAAARIAV